MKSAANCLKGSDGLTVPNVHVAALRRLLVMDARLLYCKECDYQFSVTVGTIFHDSHLPLTKWFMATLLLCEAKKGMTANQLGVPSGASIKVPIRLLGISVIAFVLQWLKLRNRCWTVLSRWTKPMSAESSTRGRGWNTPDNNKEIVIGIRQRGGELRFFHAIDAKSGTLAKYIQENISTDVEVMVTDELPAYPKAMIGSGVHGSKHKTIRHRDKVYVHGDIHTNTVESAFSLLKRGIMGSWHKISAKHLPAYLAEMEFRFNRRKSPALFLDTLRHMVTAPVLTFEKLTA